jgi:hypothetical protein
MAIKSADQRFSASNSEMIVGSNTTIGHSIVTRRRLRYTMAFFWLLDGALQLQSYMFTKGFARDIIAPVGSGQPFFIADPVHWNAQLIAHDPVPFNCLFAGVQLALGLGLLFGRTAKVAIGGSVLWAIGVWCLGEGLGGIAGGHTTALLGAPGAAALYVVLSFAAWPGRGGTSDDRLSNNPASWTVYAWSGLWVGFAFLSVLPANISSKDIGDQLSASASTSPFWLATFDRTLAGSVRSMGPGASVLWVMLELAIGLLVLRNGASRTWAVWTGFAVTFLFWAAGQSFGELFSGKATDPSTGPLLMVLGLVVLSAPDLKPVMTLKVRHFVAGLGPGRPRALAAQRGPLGAILATLAAIVAVVPILVMSVKEPGWRRHGGVLMGVQSPARSTGASASDGIS